MDKLLSISGASNQTRKSRLFMLYLNKLKNSQGPRNLTFFLRCTDFPRRKMSLSDSRTECRWWQMSRSPPAKCRVGCLSQALGLHELHWWAGRPSGPERQGFSPNLQAGIRGPSASPRAMNRDGLRPFSRAGSPPTANWPLPLEETQLDTGTHLALETGTSDTSGVAAFALRWSLSPGHMG